MDRIYNDQMINTFIPTFLLWGLGYSTLFININDFSDRYMGAVTALLVLASLLASINQTLPRTSYFKYIDMWFLWYLANLFVIILYHITLDFENIPEKSSATTGFDNDLTFTKPMKIKIGEKIQVHPMEKLSHQFDNIFRSNEEPEDPSKKKNSFNKRAILFFPALIICFNIVYFIITT